MHKGYAFVQFANPFDARSACLGEDGRTISGQVVGRIYMLTLIIQIPGQYTYILFPST